MAEPSSEPGSAASARRGPGATLVARQAIVDRERHVVGYELLYRAAGSHERASIGDGRRATAHVLTEALLRQAGGDITSGLPAWVNMTEDLLTEHVAERVASPAALVVEVLETVEATPAVLRACLRLREQGFRVALDDVVHESRVLAFAGAFDIVKVDWNETPQRDLAGIIREVRRTGGTLLAEKLETAADVERAHVLGFDLLQGFAIRRPEVCVSGGVLSSEF